MAIFGFGVDLVEIVRFEFIIKKLKCRFAKKLLSDREWEEYQTKSKPVIFLAKRFAVKEATVKALGIGIRNGIFLNQIEVFNNNLGKPGLNLLGKAKFISDKLGIQYIHVSLSDEKKYVFAAVIIEN